MLWVLYDRILRVTPDTVDDPERDRFLLSKGHGPAAFYAVLAAKGFIPQHWLDDMGGPDSRLGHHPDRMRVPGVEIGSGSLGHGLGLGRRARRSACARRVCSGRGCTSCSATPNWTRAPTTRRSRTPAPTGLDTITAIVIDNQSATHGWPGGIAARFTVNGWTATTVDGRDHDAIEAGIAARHAGRPHVVVARVERQGVTAMRETFIDTDHRPVATTIPVPPSCWPTSPPPPSRRPPTATPTGCSTSASASS